MRTNRSSSGASRGAAQQGRAADGLAITSRMARIATAVVAAASMLASLAVAGAAPHAAIADDAAPQVAVAAQTDAAAQADAQTDADAQASADAQATQTEAAAPAAAATDLGFVGAAVAGALPATVTIDGKAEAVTWSDDSIAAAKTAATGVANLTVTGTAAGKDVTGRVTVVPADTRYFIDSGSTDAAKTTEYQAVKAALGGTLLNADAADQQWDGKAADKTWGWSGGNGTGVIDGKDADEWQNTFISANYDRLNGQIVYHLTLQPGRYAIGAAQAPWKHPNQVYTTISIGDEVIGAKKAVKTTNAAPFVTQSVYVAKESVVDVTVGTVESSSNGFNTRLALVYAAYEGDEATDKVALKEAIDKAEGVKTDGRIYAAHSLETLNNALEQATKVRDGKDYDQNQVDWQVKVLNAVMDAMAEKNANATRYSSVQVGKEWLDTDGAPIQAHGGGFLQQTDTDGTPIYYWVGEDKTHNSANFNGVSLYSSKDLVNWTFRNVILRADADTMGLEGNKIERPKLVYNEKTHKYVLWGHWEGYDSYASSQIVVATSDTVDGDYQYLGHWRPGADADHHDWRTQGGSTYWDKSGETIADVSDESVWGTGSRDFTIFVDDNAKAYLISAQDHMTMRIYQLNDDYTDVAFNADGKPAMTYQLFNRARREAPALTKINGKYVMISSAQSGWYPNQTRYSTTSDIADPDGWNTQNTTADDGTVTRMPTGMIGNNTSFYSQPTNIMQVQGSKGTSLVYMGDRWNSKALRDSTYVWLPLTVTQDAATGDLTLAMDYASGWSLNTATGEAVKPDVELLSQGDGVTTSTDATVSDDPLLSIAQANDGDYFNTKTTGGNPNYFKPLTADGKSAQVPFTYQMDLGQIDDLSRIDISFNSWNGSETYYQYTLESSLNGTDWIMLADETANTTVGFKSHDVAAQGRYLKLTVNKVINDHNGSSASWAAGIVEFQAFGRKTGKLTPETGTALTAEAYKVAGKDAVNRVQLRFDGVDAADTYTVYRSAKADMADAEAIATVASGAPLSYDDILPEADATYYYQVKGFMGDQLALESEIASARVFAKLPDGMRGYDNQTGKTVTAAAVSDAGADAADATIVSESAEAADAQYRYLISGNSDKAAENGYVVKEQRSIDGGATWTDTDVQVSQSDKDFLSDYKFESVSTVRHNGKTIIWAHYEKKAGYSTGALFEADFEPGSTDEAARKHVSDLVFPNGYTARDKSLFTDTDGTAYLITASNLAGETVNRHLLISKLNDDWTAVVPVGETGYVAKLTGSAPREAPAMVKYDGWYYLFSSQTAGWLPSAGGYYSSQSLTSGWSDLRQVGEASSFSTQQNGVGVTGSGYGTVSGSRWWRSDGSAGSHTTPLKLDNGYASTEYYRTVYTGNGLVIGERSGNVLSEGKSATLNGKDASASVDGDYQTAASDTSDGRWPATWQVDLGKAYPLSGIEISSYIMKGSEAWYPYTVYGSADGKNFEKILDKTAKPSANNKADYGFTDESLTGTYRYVKVVFDGAYPQNNFSKAQSWYRAQMWEIKVLGDDGLAAPDVPEPPAPVTHTVTFDANGGALAGDGGATAAVSVEDGKTVGKPADPTRDGYDFAGWSLAKDGGSAYDFGTAVTADLTLYAQWTAKETPNPDPGQPEQPQPNPEPEQPGASDGDGNAQQPGANDGQSDQDGQNGQNDQSDQNGQNGSNDGLAATGTAIAGIGVAALIALAAGIGLTIVKRREA